MHIYPYQDMGDNTPLIMGGDEDTPPYESGLIPELRRMDKKIPSVTCRCSVGEAVGRRSERRGVAPISHLWQK